MKNKRDKLQILIVVIASFILAGVLDLVFNVPTLLRWGSVIVFAILVTLGIEAVRRGREGRRTNDAATAESQSSTHP
ncbi:hypothetical protein GCM10027403_16120 [Arthrobacter tecti]